MTCTNNKIKNRDRLHPLRVKRNVDTIYHRWKAAIRRRNGISANRVFPTGKNGKGERERERRGKKSFEIPRHMLNGPSRLPPPLPGTLPAPLPCREIQIYAPTAPGVFFELMKNESSRQGSRLHPPPPQTILFASSYAVQQGSPPSASTPLPSYRFNFLSNKHDV